METTKLKGKVRDLHGLRQRKAFRLLLALRMAPAFPSSGCPQVGAQGSPQKTPLQRTCGTANGMLLGSIHVREDLVISVNLEMTLVSSLVWAQFT